MLASAFDSAVARIGHRGPGATELAMPVLADRPDALLAAANRVPRSGWPGEEPQLPGAQACRALAYDTTVRFTHQFRLAVRELGRRLLAEDKIAVRDDVFHLTVEEALVVPGDARLRIKRRAAERERLHAIRLPAVIDGAWSPIAGRGAAQVGDQLHGAGQSPGVVEGTIRVVDTTAGTTLAADEIAVVSTIDIESVLVLGTPAAVLSVSDAALTAPTRDAAESGVPVVAGIGAACASLRTGMRVRVDGSTGLVTVLAMAADAAGELVEARS
jgi:phosphohistidine swiveling domain-containing protein